MLKLRFKNIKQGAIWLVEPKVTLGRAIGNDLVVDGEDVDERHAEILVNYETLTLVNLSGGQLLVNDTAVQERCELHPDDVITLGKTQLQVIDPKRDAVAAASGAPEPDSGWALKANHSALSNRVFKLRDMTVVGRSNECDITLAASHLSRRHAQLEVKEGVLYVKDLGSANGTYLNGRRIAQARVKRGDELRFDTLSFGVIGPAEDLDKTTVRSVAQIPQPKRSPQRPSQQAQQPQPAVAGMRGDVRRASLASKAGAALELQEKRSGLNAMLVVAVMVVAAGAIWIASQLGLM